MDSFSLWSYIYVFVTHWTGQQIACYLQESWNTPPSDPSLGVPRWSSMRQVYGRHSCLTHSEVPLSGLCGITMAATVTHGQPRKAGTWHSWTDSGMRREKKKTQPLQTDSLGLIFHMLVLKACGSTAIHPSMDLTSLGKHALPHVCGLRHPGPRTLGPPILRAGRGNHFPT